MSAIFYQIFFFSPNDSSFKTKCFLFHLKSSSRSRDIQIFVFPSSTLFLPVSHCFRSWSKVNLEIYDVINCLRKNVITYFVWYLLEKKKRYDTETLSIVTALNKEHFYAKNHAENVQQMLFPDSFLILVNKSKQLIACKKIF